MLADFQKNPSKFFISIRIFVQLGYVSPLRIAAPKDATPKDDFFIDLEMLDPENSKHLVALHADEHSDVYLQVCKTKHDSKSYVPTIVFKKKNDTEFLDLVVFTDSMTEKLSPKTQSFVSELKHLLKLQKGFNLEPEKAVKYQIFDTRMKLVDTKYSLEDLKLGFDEHVANLNLICGSK